jgi:beta-galactosidase
MIPVVLNSKTLPFNELNVSLGDARFYIDNKLQQVWLPEKPYSPGSWGYVGGHIFTMRDTNLQKFGTNQNILGTNDDPIYATQRVGLSDFKLDVPDGKYQVTLLFAELLSNKEKQALVYNLNSSAQKAEAANRSFDIFINNQKVADALGGDNYLQPERAFSVRYSIDVTSGAGIDVNFKPIAGETILNGIQVKRIY